MKKIKLCSLVLIISSFSCAQNTSLNNKLNSYFENIPVLKPTDDIIAFLKANTKNYDTDYYIDSVYHDTLEFDTYYYHEDSSYTHFFYRADYPFEIKNTTFNNLSSIGVDLYANNRFEANRSYRKLKREFSVYFSKTRTETFYSSLMGGRGKSTYFYLNKEDKYPLMEIHWHNAVCLIGYGCDIEIYKLKEHLINQIEE